MLSLLALIALSACATGQVQEFGDTIDASSVLAVQSYAGAAGVSPQIREFDIISGGASGDGLFLQVEIPVPQQNDTSSEHSIFVIDFKPFSATSNPIVNDTIDPSLLSNCSNILETAPLSSYFETEGDSDSTVPATTSVPFFAVELAEDKQSILYTFNDSYSRFNSCDTGRDGGMWIPSSQGRTTEYSTVLVVNNIFVTAEGEGDEAEYNTAYRATTFILTWSISQYIFVDTVVSSQKRVSVELAYTSLYPVIEGDNRVTRDMVLNIGFKTTLEKAFSNSNMMKYESDKAHLLLDGVSIAAASTNPHPRCSDHGPNEDVCKQIWDFNLVIPDTYFGTRELSGSFFYRLELVRCDDLEGDLNLCAAQSTGLGEEIVAIITLDNIIEVRSDKETGLQLKVVSVRDPSGQADFLFGSGSQSARGIYHREEVEIWLAPARNYPLITQYGLELVAFLVCIDNKVPIGAKRGCLEAAPEDRYIAHLAEDLELTVGGSFYQASDFEAPKQQLTTNEWFASKQQYQIGFVNLALSGQTRVYKITMLFKIKSPERTKRYAMVHEMVKRSTSEEEEGQSEAGGEEGKDVSVSVNLAMGGCPGNKRFVGVDEPCSGGQRKSSCNIVLVAICVMIVAIFTCLE